MIGSSPAHTWISGPLELIFPRQCLVCTRPLRGASLCFRCTPSVVSLDILRCPRCFGVVAQFDDTMCAACQSFPLEVDRIRYLLEYAGVGRDFIRAMKYQPSSHLAGLAGELLATNLHKVFGEESWDLIVPVPSSPAMLRKRLFHPCAVMAKRIQQHLPGVPLRHALQHRGERTPQARRSHQARLQGLANLFRVTRPHLVTKKRILLVEDVITTGATAAAAGYALRSAGALSVDILALAEARVWRLFRSRVFALFQRQTARISGVLR
jgi:predicted amidophosphoribosyltransferase